MSKVKITLRSDLCASGGDGFSSVIDTDVSYDRMGFPFIGGRRLKGCLRDAAELIGTDEKIINEIFGITGSSKSGSLRISDAHIAGHDELLAEAEADNKTDPAKIISMFTYTRAFTAIENDTAKENSLRFVRCVRHYFPDDRGDGSLRELEFFADAEIGGEYESEFSDICRALRNIGYKRNRGFGAVSCEFIPGNDEKKKFPPFEKKGDQMQLEYTVYLRDKIMLPAKVSDETADYIPGTSVLGFFANKYLEKHVADEEFENIFLKNNVRFSPLYISGKNGGDYFPAPAIIGKIKGEDGVKNILRYDTDKIIKPLKSGYADYSLNIVKPLTETVYHHSTDEEGTLYTQTCLSAGQYFKGTITGKSEYLKTIYDILTNSEIRFGRSKTAEYSLCGLVNVSAEKYTVNTVNIKKNDVFVVLLTSDALVPDGRGGYDVSADSLVNALGLGGRCEFYTTEKLRPSALRYRIIMGYSSVRNMQNTHVPAISAGSVLVMKAKENMQIPSEIIFGARTGEGFGKAVVSEQNRFAAESSKAKGKNTAPASGYLSRLAALEEKTEKMRTEAIKYVSENTKDINAAQLGRFVLMTKQAADFRDLEFNMAENIKTKKYKEFFTKLIKNSQAEKYRDDMWREYILLILTLMKYEKRGGEK